MDENNERGQESEAREPVITPEQWEKARHVTRNVFNDGLALLIDADHRIRPVVESRQTSFALLIGVLYVLLATLFHRALLPLPFVPFHGKDIGLSVFFGTIVLYLGGGVSVLLCLRYLAGRQVFFSQALNVVAIAFVPIVVAILLGAVFSIASETLTRYIGTFGGLMGLLLLFSTLREMFDLSVATGIYLVPIILTVQYQILSVFYKIFF